MKIKSSYHSNCPECGETKFTVDESDGVVICTSCDIVVEDRLIDYGREWRSFSDDQTNSERTGSPLTSTRHDRGLSTVIGRRTDGRGNQLSSSQRKSAGRMRWIEEREGTNKHDRTLRFAFGEIDRITSALDLPDVIHSEACQIFREAKDEDQLPGWSIEGIASATIALAAKNHAIFRSYNDIASVSRVDVRQIERSYLKLNRELGLKIEPVTPLDHLSQVFGRAGNVATDDLRPLIGPLARDMLAVAQEDNLHIGKNPPAFAASAIYAAVRDVFGNQTPISQKSIAEIADVSTVTIRNQYTDILEHWESVDEDTPHEDQTEPRTNPKNKIEMAG